MCHMIADSLTELHEMADKIGVQRQWFQASPPASFPHYDIALSKKELARQHGAVWVERQGFYDAMVRIRKAGFPQ